MTGTAGGSPHDPGVNVREAGRIGRAHHRASWAMRPTPARILARHFGISESRVRHQRTDDPSGALTQVLATIADPENKEAHRTVAAVLAAYEERFLGGPRNECLSRLLHLREVEEHKAEAEQNRATVVLDPHRTEAYLYHAGILTEMATLEELLGLVGE